MKLLKTFCIFFFVVSLFPSIDMAYGHDLDQDELNYLKSALQENGILYNSTPTEFARFKLRMQMSSMGANSDYVAETTVKPKPEMLSIIKVYLIFGFEHIVPKGMDHILFILGLFLFSSRVIHLLYQVTAFTIAHSVTLALSVYDIFNLSRNIVEPLIALSIVYIAVENIWLKKMPKWRPLIIFAFGLLHGLGFAGVLLSLGLPQNDYLVGLVSFNIGVELAQIAIVLVAWLLLFKFQGCNWYRDRIIIPGSLAIGVVGCYWVIERLI